MARLAIIPARGGSKRIPRKNIKDFLGKPIIAYSIEAAISSSLFDEVMVSTDDEEIALIAKEYGANVPFKRSDKNADDYATTVDVIEEVLESYRQEGEVFDDVCCIYPTAPFVTKDKLNKAFQLLVNNSYDTVMPVIPYSFPIQRSFALKGEKVQMKFPEHKNTRSQDLEKTYHDAGQFYFFRSDILSKKQGLWTKNVAGIKISDLEGQDIDNEEDWLLAELKFKLFN